jgi:hypothetical protein
MADDELYKLLFGGLDGHEFWQVVVVWASSPREAEERLREYLARRDVKLMEIDPEETAIVREAAVPPGWRANAADSEHIFGMSGRVIAAPELF